MDLQIASLNEREVDQDGSFGGRDWKIELASISQKYQTVVLYNMFDFNNIDFNKSVRFKGEIDHKKLIVKISTDFSKIVVGNQHESYMLSVVDKWI